MNYRSFFTFFALSLSILLTGCAVGEDDPLISFRSRTRRFVGDYTLAKGKFITTYTPLDSGAVTNDTRTWTEQADGSVELLNTWEDNRGIPGMIYEGSTTFSFREDGTFSSLMDYELIEIVDAPLSFKHYFSYASTGTWEFLEASDEFKNRERVRITTTRTDYEARWEPQGSDPYGEENTYADVKTTDWTLIELRNKLIRMESDKTYYDDYLNDDVREDYSMELVSE